MNNDVATAPALQAPSLPSGATPPQPAAKQITQEEIKSLDVHLYQSTGYRHLPAIERGFPFPWCAKRVGGGWMIRDFPPAPLPRHPSNHARGVMEFAGWRSAKKFLKERSILMERLTKNSNNCNDNGKSSCDTNQNGRQSAIGSKTKWECEDDKGLVVGNYQTFHKNKTIKINAKDDSAATTMQSSKLMRNRDNNCNSNLPLHESIIADGASKTPKTLNLSTIFTSRPPQNNMNISEELSYIPNSSTPSSKQSSNNVINDLPQQSTNICSHETIMKIHQHFHQTKHISKQRERSRKEKEFELLLKKRKREAKMLYRQHDTREKVSTRNARDNFATREEQNKMTSGVREPLVITATARTNETDVETTTETLEAIIALSKVNPLQNQQIDTIHSPHHAHHLHTQTSTASFSHRPLLKSIHSKKTYQNPRKSHPKQFHKPMQICHDNSKQNNKNNSIRIGEDPELDQMIERIVTEYTGGVVEFDGSAVMALREAAIDMVGHQHRHHSENDETKNGNGIIGDCEESASNATSEKNSHVACITMIDDTRHVASNSQTNNNDLPLKNSDDVSLGNMIKELVGELAEDTGFTFDGSAVEMLEEVAGVHYLHNIHAVPNRTNLKTPEENRDDDSFNANDDITDGMVVSREGEESNLSGISSMIKTLVDDLEGECGVHFDEDAVEVLKEAINTVGGKDMA